MQFRLHEILKKREIKNDLVGKGCVSRSRNHRGQTGFISACTIENKTIHRINALQVFRNIHDGNLITSDSRRFARCIYCERQKADLPIQ